MKVQSITFRSPVTLGKSAVYSVKAGEDCRIHLGAGGLVVVQQRIGKTWTQHALHLAGHAGAVVHLEDAQEGNLELDLETRTGDGKRKR
ncbi:MAG TPA: hypothetical protein VFY89_08935 [Ktedonobacterales bacterium]